jgi:catechol 2,3-dioxygenase-like lactoylglutathione lyase family enzyme
VQHALKTITQEGGIQMAGIMGKNEIIQIGIIVRNIDKVKAKYAALLGVPEPPVYDSCSYAYANTWFQGAPAPKAGIKAAVFQASPVLTIELMQPNGEPSAWQEYLDSHGEGIHHIAFGVKGSDAVINACGELGYPLIQKGRFEKPYGRYAYLDTQAELKTIIELLEFDET